MSIFSNSLKKIVSNAVVIDNPASDELRRLAKSDELTTKFGSASYITRIRNRSAKFTEIIYNRPTKEQIGIMKRVVGYLNGKTLIRVDRTMCIDPKHQLACRSYITKKYARVIYMWHEMLFEPYLKNKSKPDMNTIFVPEWPEKHVFVDPNTFTTFVLGLDYSGEMKKAGLRMGMYYAKKKGGLGLHAGCKDIFVKNRKKRLIERGVLLFGLSATGKTTLTCHHHWLKEKNGEKVIIRQDDVVFLWPDGSCTGTENNFYMKTENLDKKAEPLLYDAVTSKNAILENVKVSDRGGINFHDASLTSNGRAVVRRMELGHVDSSIDLKKVNMIIFITRRNTVVPPIAKLNPEQAAAFFMLGESIETSAGDPEHAGKSIRVVGTNPFIIGSEDEEGNRFYQFIKNSKIECYLLNTGRFGENGKNNGVKITVKDSSNFIIEAARGRIKWKRDDFWGYVIPSDLKKFDWKKYYEKKEYRRLNSELKTERIAWLTKFKKLHRKVKNALF